MYVSNWKSKLFLKLYVSYMYHTVFAILVSNKCNIILLQPALKKTPINRASIGHPNLNINII